MTRAGLTEGRLTCEGSAVGALIGGGVRPLMGLRMPPGKAASARLSCAVQALRFGSERVLFARRERWCGQRIVAGSAGLGPTSPHLP